MKRINTILLSRKGFVVPWQRNQLSFDRCCIESTYIELLLNPALLQKIHASKMLAILKYSLVDLCIKLLLGFTDFHSSTSNIFPNLDLRSKRSRYATAHHFSLRGCGPGSDGVLATSEVK